MDVLEVKNSKKHTLFLPAFIDDYGFTPEEFRVFSRIMRRSLGGEKGCFESVPEMAKTLGISERLIKRALKVLVACGAISRQERPGKTDVLDFNTCDIWKPASKLVAIRKQIDDEIKASDRARKKKVVGAETTPLSEGGSGCGNAPGVGAETTPPVGAETHPEGIPIEGTPINGNCEPAETDALTRQENQFIQSVDSSQEPDERLRFFPNLERSFLPMQTMNELADLFSYIAKDQNRNTLIKDNEWVDVCRKLFDEGMSVRGIKSLYRYCRHELQFKTVTPRTMDWKFGDFKEFIQSKGVALAK